MAFRLRKEWILAEVGSYIDYAWAGHGRDDVAQTAAVMAALAASAAPVASGALASTFRQGRRIEPKVRSVLAALARMGFVAASDGGKSFFIRRAA